MLMLCIKTCSAFSNQQKYIQFYKKILCTKCKQNASKRIIYNWTNIIRILNVNILFRMSCISVIIDIASNNKPFISMPCTKTSISDKYNNHHVWIFWTRLAKIKYLLFIINLVVELICIQNKNINVAHYSIRIYPFNST